MLRTMYTKGDAYVSCVIDLVFIAVMSHSPYFSNLNTVFEYNVRTNVENDTARKTVSKSVHQAQIKVASQCMIDSLSASNNGKVG